MSEMLDPKTLTPESLYKLQSDTWEQGAIAERERIIKLLEANLDDDIETDSMFIKTQVFKSLSLLSGERTSTLTK